MARISGFSNSDPTSMPHKMSFLRHCILMLWLTFWTFQAGGQAIPPEQRASRYMESVRRQPSLLLAFVAEMPKGGDLHHHLWGAIYAESFIRWAAEDGLCVDRKTMTLVQVTCDETGERPAVKDAIHDPVLYGQMIDAFSMRNWQPVGESAHDHFFAAFPKFETVARRHVGDMLAEAASLAAADRVTYLETMLAPDLGRAMQLGAQVGWNDNFDEMRKQLLANGLEDVVSSGRKTLDEDEARMREALQCGTKQDSGCDVTVRYLYQVLRGYPPEQVFSQILTGFEIAQADARVVGLNLVMPEDWLLPMRDFSLHMRMIDHLHKLYPKVHISLHAGELASGLVPPDGLRSHIRESVEIGHAERIGHGVAVMHETNPLGLLKEMARRNVLVEICLTSNDMILDVSGPDHPLPMYMLYRVPVALATDDEGVARSNMTEEYVRAIQAYGLTYADVKRMARQSLEHSFLPGPSLWKDTRQFQRVAACASDRPSGSSLSGACRKFLDSSERARVQWKEEATFGRFERQF
jgi:adenosine deaminase